MGWGIDFKADIFISKESFDSIEDVEEGIDDLKEDIARYRQKLLMYASASPKAFVPDEWKDEAITKLHNDVNEIMDDLEVAYKQLQKLEYYKQYLEDKEITQYPSFTDTRYAVERLKSDYEKYGNIYIGLDFDSTIYDWGRLGLDLRPTINLIKRASDAGLHIILWTLTPNAAPAGMNMQGKIDYCKELGIKLNQVNQSPILSNQEPYYNIKPFFNILLDDRAGLGQASGILETFMNELNL